MMRILAMGLTALLLAACQEREADRETRLQSEERQTASVDLEAEEQSVRAQIERYQAAEEAKDAATIANLFAENGFAIYDGDKLEGRDAVCRFYEEGYGTFSGGYDGPEGRVTSGGRYLTVWKKTPEGWRVAVDATSDLMRTAENQS